MADDIMLGDTPKARRRRHRLRDVQTAGRLWKHSTLADIDGLPGLGALDDYFVFTLVRNPWDRLVSYYHWLQEQRFAHPAVTLAQTRSFGDFLRSGQTQSSLRGSPYRRYLCAADGRQHCAAWIRLEHFREDAQPLLAHLGFDLVLQSVNASNRARDYRGYYQPEEAELVAQLCAEDIKRFGYRFEG